MSLINSVIIYILYVKYNTYNTLVSSIFILGVPLLPSLVDSTVRHDENEHRMFCCSMAKFGENKLSATPTTRGQKFSIGVSLCIIDFPEIPILL